ncbi:MAG: hypothetical protein ACI9W5_000577, partial [Ulvibacter sp.]
MCIEIYQFELLLIKMNQQELIAKLKDLAHE